MSIYDKQRRTEESLLKHVEEEDRRIATDALLIGVVVAAVGYGAASVNGSEAAQEMAFHRLRTCLEDFRKESRAKA